MNYFAFVAALLLSYNCVAQGRGSYDCPANISKKMRPPGNSYIALETGGIHSMRYKDAGKSNSNLYSYASRPRYYVAACGYKPLTYWLEVFTGVQAMQHLYGLRADYSMSGAKMTDLVFYELYQFRIPLGFNFNITHSTQMSMAAAAVYSNFVDQWWEVSSSSVRQTGIALNRYQAQWDKGDYGGNFQLGADIRVVQTLYKGLRANAQFSMDSRPLFPIRVTANVIEADGTRQTYSRSSIPTMMYAGLGLSYRFF